MMRAAILATWVLIIIGRNGIESIPVGSLDACLQSGQIIERLANAATFCLDTDTAETAGL